MTLTEHIYWFEWLAAWQPGNETFIKPGGFASLPPLEGDLDGGLYFNLN